MLQKEEKVYIYKEFKAKATQTEGVEITQLPRELI